MQAEDDATRARRFLTEAEKVASADLSASRATIGLGYAMLSLSDRLAAVLSTSMAGSRRTPHAREPEPDRSQYADQPDAIERSWLRGEHERQLADVQRVEALVDPDPAATSAALRDEEDVRHALDREPPERVGVFGQMGGPEEDG